jgi:hypothetical protein
LGARLKRSGKPRQHRTDVGGLSLVDHRLRDANVRICEVKSMIVDFV